MRLNVDQMMPAKVSIIAGAGQMTACWYQTLQQHRAVVGKSMTFLCGAEM